MGKVNLLTVVANKRTSVNRKQNEICASGKPSLPDDAKMTANTSPTSDKHSPRILLPAVQSDFERKAPPARRAIISFDLPPNRRTRAQHSETTLLRSLSPPTQSLSQSSPRSISSRLRGRSLQRAIQDRYPSILECLIRRSGDAQASPSHEQDTMDGSPIDAAVRHVQEHGCSARAEALQVVGMLLKRICQLKIEKEEVRNVLFITCTGAFARDPLDNIEEVSFAFQLLCVLIQEDIMKTYDFVKAATMLAEEGNRDGCQLLVKLIFGDDKLKLAAGEVETLTDIVSNLKSGRNKGKAKA